MPGAATDILGWVNRSLPDASERGNERRYGYESETPLTQSWLTTLTRKAAKENNELSSNR